MKLAKVTDGVVEVVDSASEWPNVSLPKAGPDAQWREENNVVLFANAPKFDSATQKRIAVAPFLEDGKCQRWQVVDLTEEDIAAIAERELTNQVNAIENEFIRQMDALKAGYSEQEVMTWPQQKDEAKAFTADPSANVPLMTAIAAESGETLAEVAVRINTKVLFFAQESGRLLGEKRKALAALGIE
jgi:hypothetical protein